MYGTVSVQCTGAWEGNAPHGISKLTQPFEYLGTVTGTGNCPTSCQISATRDA